MFQKKLRLLFFSLLFISYNTFGQSYYNYVSRFAQPSVYGTARMQALGGSGVALGADLSSAAMNPGGLGMYNKSDMGGSMTIGVATSNSSYATGYETNHTRGSKGWFSIPNLGVSFYNASKNPNSAFKGGSFAITYNKITNYQNQMAYSGMETQNTMAEDFVENTNGDYNAQANIDYDLTTTGPVQTPSALYYYSGLVTGPGGNNPPYQSSFPPPSGSSSFPEGLNAYKNDGTVTTQRGQYLWNFAYGANFLNRIYVGASVGISLLNYKLHTQHEETVVYNPNVANNLSAFTFEEYDQHRSVGINLKVGGIFKVTDQFRIGVTALTPTSQMIKETYSQNINSQYYVPGDFVNSDVELTPQYYRYKYVAPPRFEGAATYVFGKSGLVTAGMEYLPYSWASLKDPNSTSEFRADNKIIKEFYRNTLNIKVGLELRNGIYYYRFGGACMPDPYKKTFDNVNRDQWNISAGWGVRTSKYYFDIALVNTRFKGIYKPYVLDNGSGPVANYKSSIVQVNFTAGILY